MTPEEKADLNHKSFFHWALIVLAAGYIVLEILS